MPELPEVTWMTERISKAFRKCRLEKIKVLTGRYLTKEIPGIELFKAGGIKQIRNKGKFIWILLDNDISVWITLGLSGELGNRDESFARVKFKTNCGNFYLNDMRNFGTVCVRQQVSALQNKLRKLGPDPLHEPFEYKTFKERYQKQNQEQKIGDVLLKQDFIAGIGNYLRAEILYRAKVSPHCKLKEVPERYLKRVYKFVIEVIQQSYKHQKAHGLHTFPFQVYRKRYDPNEKPVIGEPFKGKRTMWWVPTDVTLKCEKN